MSGLDWLIARPVAHRGLHDAARGIIENTPSAFSAAVAANYAIECDVQITADGEAMVTHDDALGRLTQGSGRLDAMNAADLKHVRFKATADRMITLGELCELVAGRVTLVVELKSQFNGDRRIAARAAQVLRTYRGPAAAMSFDPAQIVALRELAPSVARRHRRAAKLQRRRMAGIVRAHTSGAGLFWPCPAHAPAIHRALGQRPTLSDPHPRPQSLGSADSYLDRA